MLSLFPDLLDWSWYVPFVFRVILGAYFCHIGFTLIQHEGHTEHKNDRSTWIFLGALLFLLGLLFVVGLYAQALGSTGFALSLFALYLRAKKSHHVRESLQFYFLFGIVSLSLVFLGAGPYAFDLPL
ncbi:MAG TPA: hypothetical protein VJJ02_00550 [Candidatus Paceibacterota bacterium]